MVDVVRPHKRRTNRCATQLGDPGCWARLSHDQSRWSHARVTDALSLAALNEGDALSLTRLQNMLNLTPGNLVTHLGKLEDAGYLASETTRGRAALDVYTDALRNLLRGLAP
jgi:DNA-binding MarR family transcriptional regulator